MIDTPPVPPSVSISEYVCPKSSESFTNLPGFGVTVSSSPSHVKIIFSPKLSMSYEISQMPVASLSSVSGSNEFPPSVLTL